MSCFISHRPRISPPRGIFVVAPFTLSTRITTAWTFTSGHVDGTVDLPLPILRFAPALDLYNSAPNGRAFTVPFLIQRQPGASAGSTNTVRVQISYNDGVTWAEASVTRTGEQGTVALQHPATAGFVSLRTQVADSTGASLDMTIIRAYRI